MKILVRKNEFLFFIVWAVYLAAYALLIESEIRYEYDVGNMYNYIRLGCILIFALLAVNGKFYANRIPIMLLCALAILVSVVGAHSVSFFMTFVVGLAMKEIEVERFIKFDMVVRALLLFFIFILCALGIVENYTSVINGTYKQALGFGHPNTLGLHIAVIIVEWIFLYFKKVKFSSIFLLSCAVYILYRVGTSRTAIVLLVGSIIFTIILKSNRVQTVLSGKVGRGIITALPTIICGLCYICATFYNRANALWLALDSLLTTRIYWANYYLSNVGLSLFGTNIDPVSSREAKIAGSTQSSVFDMSYVRIGVEYGAIILVIFIICLMLVQNYAIRTKKWGLLVANTYYIMLGIVENSLYSVAMNPFLVCIVLAILGLLEENRASEGDAGQIIEQAISK